MQSLVLLILFTSFSVEAKKCDELRKAADLLDPKKLVKDTREMRKNKKIMKFLFRLQIETKQENSLMIFLP